LALSWEMPNDSGVCVFVCERESERDFSEQVRNC
jgi:hypothetical protein